MAAAQLPRAGRLLNQGRLKLSPEEDTHRAPAQCAQHTLPRVRPGTVTERVGNPEAGGRAVLRSCRSTAEPYVICVKMII